MQISALGPLTLDGRPVPGSRLGALVLALVLARGRIVPAASLIESIWAGAAPSDPSGALQSLVSRSRRLGLTVAATAGGYRLHTADLDVDVLRARDLRGRARAACRSGDRAHALLLAREALTLWPDDDADPASGTDPLREELLVIVAESALAARGLEPDALQPDELDALLRSAHRNPIDEPLVALVMRALAACGRQAEALAAYEDLRRTLASRYGTDPAPVVARTHVALLRGELSPGTPRPAPGGRLLAARVSSAAPPRPPWRRPTTPLLGRDRDVAALELELERHRLVTLVAVGGAGKTRLAVEVVRRAAVRGTRVRVAELASITAAAGVLPAVIAALRGTGAIADGRSGVHRAGDRPASSPREQLELALAELDDSTEPDDSRTRASLLVLDNCEHLRGAVADVAAVLLELAAPALRVLTTSRAPLAVVGEWVHPVTALADAAAVELLEARARAGRPGLALRTDLALELCHRLDNLPLALELAGARLRSMPLADVLAGVTLRFALLDGGLRGLPGRQSGLRAMVDWSWVLLEPADRALLADLTVVPAPPTAGLALAVARSGDASQVRDGLARLVDHSLLSLEDSDGDGPARYRMLETVREFGAERLAADGDPGAAMQRLTTWAAARARALRAGCVGAGQVAAVRESSADGDTLVAALGWAVDHSRRRAAYALAAALLTVGELQGRHAEVAGWARLLLEADAAARRRAQWALRPGAPGTGPRSAREPVDLDGDLDGAGDLDDCAAFAALALRAAAIVSDARTHALALRLARWTLGPDAAGHLTPRTAALARAAVRSSASGSGARLAAANELAASRDAYLSGVGLLLRASLRERDGRASEAGTDARAAYAAFERTADHWGMGTAARAVGQWETGQVGRDADIWLTRAAEHLALVGAVQRARRTTVVRDLRRALNGSAEAASELARAASASSASSLSVSAHERAFAAVGLGVLAAVGGRPRDAVRHAGEGVRVARGDARLTPRDLAVIEVAAAAVLLAAGPDEGADSGVGAEAEGLLAAARDGALACRHLPTVGSVALGYSKLARSRGESVRAAELEAIGLRLGASLAINFGVFGALRSPLAALSADDVTARAHLAAAGPDGVGDCLDRLATLLSAPRLDPGDRAQRQLG